VWLDLGSESHEALRLFQDRLVDEDERAWTADAIRRIALEHFPTLVQTANPSGELTRRVHVVWLDLGSESGLGLEVELPGQTRG
jgi:hypothetical protein